MLARGGGSIVNISSGSARQPAAMNVDYGAAKAGLNNLTKALSVEFAPQGIRVNSVSPGPVLTPWWTDKGGAADIIAAKAGTDRDSVLNSVGPGDDGPGHRPARRSAGDRRRGRAARLAAFGQHDWI
jgi:NAD(P)-dependent dehydrogenase (short-subunit alcohol dehydrogenase family)